MGIKIDLKKNILLYKKNKKKENTQIKILDFFLNRNVNFSSAKAIVLGLLGT